MNTGFIAKPILNTGNYLLFLYDPEKRYDWISFYYDCQSEQVIPRSQIGGMRDKALLFPIYAHRPLGKAPCLGDTRLLPELKNESRLPDFIGSINGNHQVMHIDKKTGRKVVSGIYLYL